MVVASSTYVPDSTTTLPWTFPKARGFGVNRAIQHGMAA